MFLLLCVFCFVGFRIFLRVASCLIYFVAFRFGCFCRLGSVFVVCFSLFFVFVVFCHCSFAEVSEFIIIYYFFVLLFHGVVIFMHLLLAFFFLS